MSKKILAMFMAVAMAFSLLPVTVFAANEDSSESGSESPVTSVTSSQNGVNISKKVETDRTGKHSLVMEAYVEGNTSTTISTKPLDIVLVLDVSGSMDDKISKNDETKKMDALKTAVNNFIDKVAEKNPDAEETAIGHRISIVKFAGNRSDSEGDTKYWDSNWKENHNYSQTVKNLTDVTGNGAQTLKDAVNALAPAGATHSDYGMQLAKQVLENTDSNRGKVVVMFTDGSPNKQSGFDESVASDAINTAKELKQAETKVYTVGLFDGANPQADIDGFWTSKENKYMQAVSSNYPDATLTSTSVFLETYWKWNWNSRATGNYYLAAQDANDLNNVFEEISSSITTAEVTADASSVLQDTLTEQFALDNARSITVQKQHVTGKDSEGNYTWGEPEDAGLTANISGKNVTVTGFDYTAEGNLITEKDGKYSGYKLVVTIPIQVDDSYTGWLAGKHNYDTNTTTTSKAGLTGYTKDGEEASTLLDESPQLPVTAYTVTYDWGTNNVPDGQTLPTDSRNYIPGQQYIVNADFTSSTTIVDSTTGGKYQFSGWNDSSNGVMGTGDVTIIGSWSYTPPTTADITVNFYKDSVSEENKVNKTPFVMKNQTIGDEITLGAPVIDMFKPDGYNSGVQQGTVPYIVVAGTNEINVLYTKPAPPTMADITVNFYKDSVSEENKVNKTPFVMKNQTIGDEITLGAPVIDMFKPDGYNSGVQQGTVPYVVVADTNVINVLYTKKEVNPTVTLDVSRSKTTTNLDNNYESTVTLSLPSAEVKNVIDVVFVVDNAFPEDNDTAAVQARELMRQLNEISEGDCLDVNVGLVISGGYVPILHTVDLADISKTNEEIQDALDKSESTWKQQEGRKGSNIQAGIEKARDMLNEETTASKENKYLILISDGGAFSWYDKETETTWAKFFQINDNYYWCNPGDFGKRYTEHGETQNVNRSFRDLMKMSEADIDAYSIARPDESEWSHQNSKGTKQYAGWYTENEIQSFLDSHQNEFAPSDTVAKLENNYVTSREAALYHTTKSIAAASKEANVIFVSFAYYYKTPDGHENSNLFKYTEEFKNYLEHEGYVKLYRVNGDEPKYQYPSDYKGVGDSSEVFDSIKNELIYLVDAGSTVVDKMGPNFDFVGLDTMTLTVGGTELVTKIEGDTAYFGNAVDTLNESSYRFKVVYNSTADSFTWTINEPVTKENPVQLSYKVKLIKVETAAGTYGQVDLNGDGKIDGSDTDVTTSKALYTNESATLTPKDSQGNEGQVIEFPKPSVSYTVKRNNGGSGGSSRPTLNTKDHYGYIIGYPVDYYTGEPTTDQTKKPVRPEGKITRAEVATIYFRMLTDESRTKFWSQSNAYSDVKAGEWFNNAVSTLSNAGIIAGYEDGTFRPNGYITRAEFATIAARFFDATYNGKDLFPDIDGHWAKDYINKAADKGFVNGYEDGTFRPDRNITRAEAVTLVNRTLDRHPDKNYFTKDMLVWPDNMDTTKWYYADMQEATNSHKYQMLTKSDKTQYEKWTQTQPIRNWEALEKAWSNANSSQGTGNVV